MMINIVGECHLLDTTVGAKNDEAYLLALQQAVSAAYISC